MFKSSQVTQIRFYSETDSQLCSSHLKSWYKKLQSAFQTPSKELSEDPFGNRIGYQFDTINLLERLSELGVGGITLRGLQSYLDRHCWMGGAWGVPFNVGFLRAGFYSRCCLTAT